MDIFRSYYRLTKDTMNDSIREHLYSLILSFFMKGDNIMSLLYGTTSVFIDFEGMLYDTDTYVVRELYDYIRKQDGPSMFDSMYELFDNLSIENIKYALQLKSFPNPLMEFIESLGDDDDTDLEEVADEVYNSTLYTFKLPEGEITPETNILRLTSIGAGLKSIINDPNFKTLYIYVTRELNNDIIKLINEELDTVDCDIVFLTGDKKKAMNTEICDFYFLSKVSDIYHICDKHHESEINVLVPTFEFNMDDDVEVPLVNLEENAIITKRKYNIEVCTTNIPIL